MKSNITLAVVFCSLIVTGCMTNIRSERPYAVTLAHSLGEGVYRLSTTVASGDGADAAQLRLLAAAATSARGLGGTDFVILDSRDIPTQMVVVRPGYLQMTYINGQPIPISIPASTQAVGGGREMTIRVLKLKRGATPPPNAIRVVATQGQRA